MRVRSESAYFDNLTKLMPERRSYIDDDTDEWNSEWKQGKLFNLKFNSRYLKVIVGNMCANECNRSWYMFFRPICEARCRSRFRSRF